MNGMEASHEDLNNKLMEFSKQVENDIILIQSGAKMQTRTKDSAELKQLKGELVKIVEEIAKSGDSHHYNWKYLKSYIIILTRDVLTQMQSSYPDMKSVPGESFDDELDVILQFLYAFD